MFLTELSSRKYDPFFYTIKNFLELNETSCPFFKNRLEYSYVFVCLCVFVCFGKGLLPNINITNCLVESSIIWAEISYMLPSRKFWNSCLYDFSSSALDFPFEDEKLLRSFLSLKIHYSIFLRLKIHACFEKLRNFRWKDLVDDI